MLTQLLEHILMDPLSIKLNSTTSLGIEDKINFQQMKMTTN